MVADDRITYTMENDDLSIYIDPVFPLDFFKGRGMSGMGLAPTTLTITDSIGGGGRWRATRRGVRTSKFPIHIYGEGRDQLQSKLGTLVRILNDRFSTPKLVASLPNGQVYEIEMHYSDGFDYEWGTDTDGRSYVSLGNLTLVFPDPYWTARFSQTLRLQASSGRGILKGNSMTKMQLSGSAALGKLVISNPGDVDAYPLWRLTGPGTSFTATRDVDGATMSYVQAIGAGQSIFIDTRDKTVYDTAGTNLYGNMGPAPKFFSLPPGDSSITVQLEGATSDSIAQMQYRIRRELLF